MRHAGFLNEKWEREQMKLLELYRRLPIYQFCLMPLHPGSTDLYPTPLIQ
jgi:hypothetical protein